MKKENPLAGRVLNLAGEIQEIPAPTFEESQRAEFVSRQMAAANLEEVQTDTVGNVYGCLRGQGLLAPVVLTAHLDTVFPATTPLTLNRSPDRWSGPGIGDNSLGVAGLFGAIWGLQQTWQGKKLPGDLWVVATVGEEGLGNLRGMRAVVDYFKANVIAYLVLEGMALGHIYHQGLAVERFRIRIQTKGGHSWVDFGQPSAIHEMAALISNLTAISLPEKPRTTFNVGTINGGMSINSIAGTATIELDLRSEDQPALKDLVDQVKQQVMDEIRPDVHIEIEAIGQRPAGKISARHPLVRLAQRCLERQKIPVRLGIGSTDTNLPLSRGLPAIGIGLTHGGGAHTMDEYILTDPLAAGLEAMIELVASLLKGNR